MRQFIFGVCLLWSATAWSVPVSWTVDSVNFGIAGGTATGSFVYDADTNTYSNINITTWFNEDATDMFGIYTYLSPNDTYPASDRFLPTVSSGSPDLEQNSYGFELFFDEALTNAGGTVAIQRGFEGLCDDPNCVGYDYEWPWREAYAGTISAVPIPAAVWLFGSALAGLGWVKRKQSV